MSSEETLVGEGCSVRAGNNAEGLFINNADEAQYRWWPQEEGRSTSPVSSAGAGHPQDVHPAFEARNQQLARRWFSAVPSSNTDTDTGTRRIAPEVTSREEDAVNGDQRIEGKGFASPSHDSPTAEEPGVVPTGPSGSSGSTAASPQLLFLVRHGETDMNAAGRPQGRGIDAKLNHVGIRQATGLGRFLRNVPFDTVTSSSLSRAYETAVIVVKQNVKCVKQAQTNGSPAESTMQIEDCSGGDRKQVPVRKCEGLDELSWGELEGQDVSEEPWSSKMKALKCGWDSGDFDRAACNGESLMEVKARSRKAVETCLDRGKALNLIVSHGRTLRILILSLTGLGLDRMANMGKVPNTGLYVIEARQANAGGARSYHLLTPTS